MTPCLLMAQVGRKREAHIYGADDGSGFRWRLLHVTSTEGTATIVAEGWSHSRSIEVPMEACRRAARKLG